MENADEKKNIVKCILLIIILILLIIFGPKLMNKNEEHYVNFIYYGNTKDVVLTTNQKVEKPTDPILEDHIFKGWYYENDLFDFDTKIKEEITLTAKWEEIPEANTNTSSNTNSNQNNNKPSNENSNSQPEKTYIFVTFNSNGGSSVSSKKIEKGTTVTEPSNPTKTGYNFLGWVTSDGTAYNFNNTVEKDLILYAKWEKISKPNTNTNQNSNKPSNENSNNSPAKTYVTVTFNSNGGSSVSSKTIEKSTTVTKPSNPTRSGYTFLGWITSDGTSYNFSSKVEKDLILYAKWEKISNSNSNTQPTKTYVTVTFNSNGGSSVSSRTIEKSTTVTKPSNPTRSGYTFLGWYTSDGTSYNFSSKVEKNLTLYAKWEKISNSNSNTQPTKTYVTVTFNSNGGSSVSSKKIEKGTTVAKPSNPTRSGYTFLGWYTSSRSEFNFSTKVNSNTTLSALWAPKINYTKNTSGKWIYINNPESLVLTSYLADSNLGNSSLYADKINGKAEIFYSHNVNGPLSGQIYYAIRVYNVSNSKNVTININNCGITSNWDSFAIWEQYYKGTCNIAGKTYIIPPRTSRYFYHNGSNFAFGDDTKVNNISKPTTVFNGVLNVTTNGELAMSAIAFKDVSKTYNATYKGNVTDVVTSAWGQTTPARMYSGYYNGLPIVTNNVTFEIYNETPKGELNVSYVNSSNSTKIDNQWITNNAGAELYNYKVVQSANLLTSDMIPLNIRTLDGKTIIAGPYPTYKESRTSLHHSGRSMVGWPFNLGNWAVHYKENITIKNNSSTSKSVSFILPNTQNITAYYNGSIIKCKENTSVTVWTVTIPAKSSKTIPTTLVLNANAYGTVVKKVVLNN